MRAFGHTLRRCAEDYQQELRGASHVQKSDSQETTKLFRWLRAIEDEIDSNQNGLHYGAFQICGAGVPPAASAVLARHTHFNT